MPSPSTFKEPGAPSDAGHETEPRAPSARVQDRQAPGSGLPRPVKKPKRPIKSSVTIHDRTQIEAVFDYFLTRGLTARSGATSEAKASRDDAELKYKVEAYLFYPRQFGLDASSYTKDRFYADMRPLLRFREPKLGFKALLGLKPGVTSPLVVLRTYVACLESGEALVPLASAIDEVRLLACAFISTSLRAIDRNCRRLKQAQGGPHDSRETEAAVAEALARMTRLLDKIEEVLGEIRKVQRAAAALPTELGGELALELRLVDEYLYYRLRDGVAVMVRAAADVMSACRAPAVAYADFVERVRVLLGRNDEHAHSAGFLVISPESPANEREAFIQRRGELKRRVWSVLFLDMRATPMFKLQSQISAMLAAAMAATWAVSAQILLFRPSIRIGSAADDLRSMSGAVLLIAGIIAYVVKDRIKDLGKSYLARGVFRRIPDHSEQIFYDDRISGRVPVGKIMEFVRYLPRANLPEQLQRLRDAFRRGQDLDLSGGDHILHYTKVMTMSRKVRILDRYPLTAVHDILRLNIDVCLPRLGEPSRKMSVVDESGALHDIQFPKVYYLDMAIRYSRLEANRQLPGESLDYFRLAIDKQGLIRVERLG